MDFPDFSDFEIFAIQILKSRFWHKKVFKMLVFHLNEFLDQKMSLCFNNFTLKIQFHMEFSDFKIQNLTF